MKWLVNLFVLILVLAAVPAFAGRVASNYQKQFFVTYTGVNGTARYSTAYKVGDLNSQKTVIFQHYSTDGTALTGSAGTAILQCAPSSTGPWLTAKDRAANAISSTSSVIFDLDTMCRWVRVEWTRSTARPKTLSAWVLWGD